MSFVLHSLDQAMLDHASSPVAETVDLVEEMIELYRNTKETVLVFKRNKGVPSNGARRTTRYLHTVQ